MALGNILMMGNLRKHCVIFRIHWLMPSWAVYLLVVGKESSVITILTFSITISLCLCVFGDRNVHSFKGCDRLVLESKLLQLHFHYD